MTTWPVSVPRIVEVTAEHHRDPLGIGESAPRLSWKTVGPPSWSPREFQVVIDRPGRRETSSWVNPQETVLVPWPSAPLASREHARVRVRARDDAGACTDWSESLELEAGLLSPGDWAAKAVSPAWEEQPRTARRPPLLRKCFTLTDDIAKARLYVSAHGLYEIHINGRRVGDEALAPGWTSYAHRLRYRTHDVTDLLRAGENVIGARLGDGWYRGRLGFDGGHSNVYGDRLALIAQLEVTHHDGRQTVIVTDTSWRATPGPILSSGLLDGETYDARLEIPDWSSPGFDYSNWSGVVVVPRDMSTLVAPMGPPVRCTQRVSPVDVRVAGEGRLILDFGQNLVGRLQISVSGPAGHRVTMRHAEVLQDGELCVRPLRGALSTDCYILSGKGVEQWEPSFTLHGFRYAEISGWLGGDPMVDVVALVYHTDMRRTGWFECSDPLVNRLHENVVWSMRGNFVDLPTDCPQRDERFGWTGDIQVFAPTAAFLYDCHGLLASWLRDVAVEQVEHGTVPWYVPVVPGGAQWTPVRPGAGWGDVAALTPWAMHIAWDDAPLLAKQYDSARTWVDQVNSLSDTSGLWGSGFQLGDWLDPAAPPEDPGGGPTDRYLIASAYFAWSARHVSLMAQRLGLATDESRYAVLSERVRQAFLAAYLLPSGRLTSDTQTAYSIALQFELLQDSQARTEAGRRLADLVKAAGHKIATGFIGTPLVLHALSSTGQLEAAYGLLLQQECPSWLYAVVQGGTTVWERWDSMLPDGTVNPGRMTSFNHYAFGALAQWLHTVVAGLCPESPGYREILFRPRPGGSITWATAEHESPYGRVAIDWQLDGPRLRIRTTVPTGTTARICWPDGVSTVAPRGQTSHERSVHIGVPLTSVPTADVGVC